MIENPSELFVDRIRDGTDLGKAIAQRIQARLQSRLRPGETVVVQAERDKLVVGVRRRNGRSRPVQLTDEDIKAARELVARWASEDL